MNFAQRQLKIFLKFTYLSRKSVPKKLCMTAIIAYISPCVNQKVFLFSAIYKKTALCYTIRFFLWQAFKPYHTDCRHSFIIFSTYTARTISASGISQAFRQSYQRSAPGLTNRNKPKSFWLAPPLQIPVRHCSMLSQPR